jgi:hypothetical protein
MQSQPQGRVDLAHGKEVLDAMRERIQSGQWNGIATLRATAKLVKEAYIEGRIGRFTFACDEPADRGGSDAAPSPLEFFLIGAAF